MFGKKPKAMPVAAPTVPLRGPTLLDPARYAGVRIPVAYVAQRHLAVTAESKLNGYGFRLAWRKYRTPQQKSFEMTLYPSFYENAEAYGLFDGDALAGVVEVNREGWNNRLRITELWVGETYRGRGVGSSLLAFAKGRARELRCRALVLETQTCNETAIRLYRNNGFAIVGIDTTGYTNDDVFLGEVRIEMGCPVDGGEAS
jgi:ribosomal protein S18 acetylase RimI-like enzyme